MAQNSVMKLWTTIVTAFLALCTTLGLITTTAAAAVPLTEIPRNSNSNANVTAPAMSPWAWAYDRSLPPTMKQRIRAEAHGSSPSCRHLPSEDDAATDPAALSALEAPAEPDAPLQR